MEIFLKPHRGRMVEFGWRWMGFNINGRLEQKLLTAAVCNLGSIFAASNFNDLRGVFSGYSPLCGFCPRPLRVAMMRPLAEIRSMADIPENVEAIARQSWNMAQRVGMQI